MTRLCGNASAPFDRTHEPKVGTVWRTTSKTLDSTCAFISRVKRRTQRHLKRTTRQPGLAFTAHVTRQDRLIVQSRRQSAGHTQKFGIEIPGLRVPQVIPAGLCETPSAWVWSTIREAGSSRTGRSPRFGRSGFSLTGSRLRSCRAEARPTRATAHAAHLVQRPIPNQLAAR